MKIHLQILILSFFAFLSSASFADSSPQLTIDRLFSSPELEGSVPRTLKFSGDGSRLGFLAPKKDNFEVLDLWEYDLRNGEARLLVDSSTLKTAPLSEAEKATLERKRISQKGIVEYEWSHDGKSLVFPYGGELQLWVSGKVRELTKDGTAKLDPHFSPRDHFVSYVRGNNLFVLDLKTKKEGAVTRDGKGPISYGVAEFIAQEEMDRFSGFWWSPDEKYLAFTRVDESQVAEVDRYEIDADKVRTFRQRYPQTGGANAKVSLFVVRIEDLLSGRSKPQPVKISSNDFYLARAGWTADGKLSYQIESRDQRKLDLFLFDPSKSSSVKVASQTDEHWINLTSNLRWLKKTGDFVWSDESTGYRHLSLHNRRGEKVRALTSGEWNVDEVKRIDEEGRFVYFTAALRSPLEKHLYRVSLDHPGEPTQLTTEDGWHDVTMAEDGATYVDRYSAATKPTQVKLSKMDGSVISMLSKNQLVEGHPLFPYKDSLIEPEFSSFKGPSGELLYERIYKPKNMKRGKKYPLVITGYGGPGHQFVRKAWSGLIPQLLADRGYVVASVDNRGTPRRGRKFEDANYHAFGTVEVEDQVAEVRHLIEQGFVDPDRVGFFGWSYGGFLALSLVTKAPDVFHAVVAAAPVTDFALYDTHYTERFLGKPKDEPAGYKQSSIMESIPRLKSRLLILHGMADDNVLFTNSTVLFKGLQDNGKVYESVTYPGAKHGIYGRKNQIHVYETITDFFGRYLTPDAPK